MHSKTKGVKVKAKITIHSQAEVYIKSLLFDLASSLFNSYMRWYNGKVMKIYAFFPSEVIYFQI